MTWSSVKLKDCCVSIADGDHQPPPRADVGVPFVTISNIDAFNSLNFENAMHVPREYYDGLDPKRRATTGDVLYSVVGSFGIPVLIKDDAPFVFQRHIAILRPDKTMLDSRFLYYTMRGKDFYHRADAAAIGAAQRTISLSALKNLEIPLPPLPMQRRIADILSAYDDLIENNRTQIKLLEEAAQRLYKEWFIDLRFPGHEHTPIINGIPEGWKKTSIEGMLRYYIGGGWGKETASAKNVCCGAVIRGTDINDIKSGDFSNLPSRFHTCDDIVKRKLNPGDIVLELSNGNIDNIGRCLLIDKKILAHCGNNTICASFCKLLRPLNKKCSVVLFLETISMQADGRLEPLKKHGSNGINNFDFEGFLNHELLFPLADDFDLSPFENSLDKISTCRSIISRTTEARNRLLPKLMWGEMGWAATKM